MDNPLVPMVSDGKIIKNYLALRVNGTVPEIVGVTLVPLVIVPDNQ